MNASRIKGSHAAIKTGLLAAEACFEALAQDKPPALLDQYPKAFESSWLHQELYKARNFNRLWARIVLGQLLVASTRPCLVQGAFTLRNTKPDHAYLEPPTNTSPSTIPSPMAC